ncbi:MAG: DUF6298 domain-containing protein [Opitutaceae bacterium]
MRKLPRLLVALWSLSVAAVWAEDGPASEQPATAEAGAGAVAVAAPRVDIDFTCVGVGAGKPMTVVGPLVWRVKPSGGDDTALLQAALDEVATRPMNANGLRGTVVLEEGTFRVAGQLRVKADGVALLGCGEKTVVLATGIDRRALIRLGGDEAPKIGAEVAVTDETVRAGSTVLMVAEVGGFAVGDRVVVRRPSTKEWIAALGMDKWEGAFTPIRLEWLPGSMDLRWDRIITAVDPTKKQLTLDAPITTALEQRFGGGFVAKVVGGEPVKRLSLGGLVLDSEYDAANPKDEEHAWIAVQIDNAEDVEVSAITARHFVSSAVRVGLRARRVSAIQCRSEAPVSELAGYRRQSFWVEGQQVLVKDCGAEAAWNAFGLGQRAAGPNRFLAGEAVDSVGPSGALESWTTGTLFEGMSAGGLLVFGRDGGNAQGGGWLAVNTIVRECDATGVQVDTGSPSPVLVEGSLPGGIHRWKWAFVNAGARSRGEFGSDLAKKIPQYSGPKPSSVEPPLASVPALEIIHGRFVIDGRVVWGGAVNTAWWKGRINPEIATNYGRSPTRFVPGRSGPGLTEELPQLADWMRERGTPFFQHWPGLWYDRRRDDHTRVDRADANCWAPFYEMPWARSGQGVAADGLSKYDLTKFNPWYFARLREFARLCGERGLVLYHNLYNTHNVLETGAHWMDFPWRPFNNINGTPLPEPPPLDDKGAIHVANEFYDAASPALRALHRAFIRHSLDQLGDQPNVIHGLAFQYAGPLAFQQFFQDTVAEWEREHGRRLRLALTTGKNVTDAILADPVRAAQIAVIDLRYWQYRPDGELWAPEAGINRAFREINSAKWGKAGGDTPPPTTAAMVYRQVREYRDRFPDKAIVAHDSGNGPVPILMAGGAQALTANPAAGGTQARAPFDEFVNRELGTVLMQLAPRDGWLAEPATNWCLADDAGTTVLFASMEGPALTLERALPEARYTAQWVDPRTGELKPAVVHEKWSQGATLAKPTAECWLLLLRAVR